MFDEPQEGRLRLVAVNDLPAHKNISYVVKKYMDITNDVVVLSGEVSLEADTAATIDSITISENEKEFYYMEWTMDGKTYKNHYFTNIIDIDYQAYMQALKKYGMDEFEGF
jgi:beta-mannosidase